MESVTVATLVDRLAIDVVAGGEYIDRHIETSEVSRPGLILTGYNDCHPYERIQLIGYTEMNYLNQKSSDELKEIFELLCSDQTPAIVFARQLPIPDELFPIAAAHRIPILVSRSKTSRTLSNISNFLEGELAERLSVHGVFVEVFGMGVLLTGASGVGKSETGLELIQRGHRLIADDRVELFQVDELTLIGEAPDILQNLIEIRGLGIIDVLHLYGVSAVRLSKRLELIIDLVVDDGTVEYDRLGFVQETQQIFDVQVPKVRIPVKIGRNLSQIIESAAMNHRAKLMGYDSKITFHSRLAELIQKNSVSQERSGDKR